MRMNEDRLVRKVLNDVLKGNRGRRRLKRKWMVGVRETIDRRWIEGDGRDVVRDRIVWRGMVYGI